MKYDMHIFRAFSAGRVSTRTLHQSARAAVSEMVMQQMRMMGKRLRMMTQIFSCNILWVRWWSGWVGWDRGWFFFHSQKNHLCAGQRRLSTSVASGTILASTAKSAKQRWNKERNVGGCVWYDDNSNLFVCKVFQTIVSFQANVSFSGRGKVFHNSQW